MSIYSDLNRKNPTQQVLVTDFEAVLQSVEVLINQPPRQRLFRPEGSELPDLLFALDGNGITPTLEWRVKNGIFKVIQDDPRVKLLYNQTTAVFDPGTHVLEIVARFTIVGLGDRVFTRIGRIQLPGGTL